MFGLRRIVVEQGTRALMFRDQRLVGVLVPGVYRHFDPLRRLRVQEFDLGQPWARVDRGEILWRECRGLLEEQLFAERMGNNELGLVREEGRITRVMTPGDFALFWRQSRAVDVERINLDESVEVAEPLRRELLSNPTATSQLERWLKLALVPPGHAAVLSVDNTQVSRLEPGIHGYWQGPRAVQVSVVDLRGQNMDIAGQEILSRDKVSLRINLVAEWRVLDPEAALVARSDYRQSLYQALQFALRQVVGARTLDTLLAEKGELDREIAALVAPQVGSYGLELRAVGIKDLILPGEMKALLNRVVEAEKDALAQTIRRREETAATRALLNTARLMEQSPVLVRLKELEALERVSAQVGQLTVVGGLEGLVQRLLPRAG